tara:strand:- start:1274 stop:2704 length:1431 start_codon:yes stop_codon:yes gene_type:complete
MSKEYATSFDIIQISLYKVGNDAKPYVNLAGDMCKQFQYFEDIMWPAYAATMVIEDNAENIISTMPIQGFERVVVEIDDLTETSGQNNGRYTYEFRVWNISNRIGSERKQTYTLGLISEEGLINEGVTVNKVLSGNTSGLVQKILGEYLKVPKIKMNVEASTTNMKILPTKKSPFTLIKSFLPKTISEKIAIKSKNKNETKSNNIDSDISDPEKKKGSGTAGYLFFQTNRGHVFRSIDSLVSTNEDEFNGSPVQSGLFYWQPAKGSQPSMFRIQEIVFGQEFDMIKKLREGHYASICCYFNINNLTYEEQQYSLVDTWDEMAHLGSQTKLPQGQTNLSEYPTRVMSTIVDNEVWNNEPKIASTETGGDGSHPYQDTQKFYLSQGLARAGILFNQQLTISLTGHLELCAGDKIEIRIPEQSAEAVKGDNAYDPEHSGTYLIKQLNHQFNIGDTRTVYTVLDLVRDSQGIKDQESNVK